MAIKMTDNFIVFFLKLNTNLIISFKYIVMTIFNSFDWTTNLNINISLIFW